jgi:Chaperone of endosialidase
MNPLIPFKKTTALLIIALSLECLMPLAQALTPAPDGGYGPPQGAPRGTTAEGTNALFSLPANGGLDNTALGFAALYHNTSGPYNTATGFYALLSNTNGSRNTANGINALKYNTSGVSNTAIGTNALLFNKSDHNTAIGDSALFGNTTGSDNTAVGWHAMLFNTLGFNNIGIGQFGGGNVRGDNNIDIGAEGDADDDGTIRIGTGGSQHTTFIAGIFGETTGQANAIPVLVDSAGQLGTTSSSARFKKDVKPMDKASEAILAFKPVTFHYKTDKTSTPQFGLIAEEVAEVNPDLVVHDKSGEVYTVRYDAVNAMLLNEFLKAHRRMEEQDKRIEELTAQLKQQAAQIQKVSAQLELSKAAPQAVLNNQ